MLGLIVGLLAALVLTLVMATFLPGVHPWDPLALGSVVVTLTAMTLLALAIPARQASRRDPLHALRWE